MKSNIGIYEVSLREICSDTFHVKAKSQEEAREIIEQMYWNCELRIDEFHHYEIITKKVSDDGDYILINEEYGDDV